ncbi:hypothetical protein D3C72_1343150 [compost metagenome]
MAVCAHDDQVRAPVVRFRDDRLGNLRRGAGRLGQPAAPAHAGGTEALAGTSQHLLAIGNDVGHQPVPVTRADLEEQVAVVDDEHGADLGVGGQRHRHGLLQGIQG